MLQKISISKSKNPKACVFLFAVLNLITFNSGACRALKDPLNLSPEELKEYQCLKEHIKIREAQSPEEKLSIAKILAIKGALDRDSLRIQARAYKVLGLADKALEAYIKSTKRGNICKFFEQFTAPCKRSVSEDNGLYNIDDKNFDDANLNLELASYFHAAGRHEEGNKVFIKATKMLDVFEMQCRASFYDQYFHAFDYDEFFRDFKFQCSSDQCSNFKDFEKDLTKDIANWCQKIAYPDNKNRNEK